MTFVRVLRLPMAEDMWARPSSTYHVSNEWDGQELLARQRDLQRTVIIAACNLLLLLQEREREKTNRLMDESDDLNWPVRTAV